VSVVWKPIPGYEGYYDVSSEGAVRCVGRFLQMRSRTGNPFVRWWAERSVKTYPDGGGYLSFRASVEGVQSVVWVHRAVCEAFRGPSPAGRPLACHRDGNKLSNREANLRWGSYRDNMLDRERHGRGIANNFNPGTVRWAKRRVTK
jgi:hypothetical protein